MDQVKFVKDRPKKQTNKKKTKIQKKAKETKEDISGKSILKNAAARVKIFSSPTFPETRLFFWPQLLKHLKRVWSAYSRP